MSAADRMAALPLFPLRTVLFPGSRLQLKVFEARYLDLIVRCLREGTPFGVLCLRQGGEVRQAREAVQLEAVGVLARVQEADAEQAGILRVSCLGGSRLRLDSAPSQDGTGLWSADARLLPDEPVLAPEAALLGSVRALAAAIGALERQGGAPFDKPYRFDDAGWAANRWCELLPITLAAKQKLLELDDPMARLRLVDEYLRGKGVVAG